MRAHEEIEVGRRAARGLVLENRGPRERRSQQIVSTAAVAIAVSLRGH